MGEQSDGDKALAAVGQFGFAHPIRWSLIVGTIMGVYVFSMAGVTGGVVASVGSALFTWLLYRKGSPVRRWAERKRGERDAQP